MAERSFSGPDGWRHAARTDADSQVVTLCRQLVGTELTRIWPQPGWAEHVAPVTCPQCRSSITRIVGPAPQPEGISL